LARTEGLPEQHKLESWRNVIVQALAPPPKPRGPHGLASTGLPVYLLIHASRADG
jgi:hypothetical protein